MRGACHECPVSWPQAAPVRHTDADSTVPELAAIASPACKKSFSLSAEVDHLERHLCELALAAIRVGLPTSTNEQKIAIQWRSKSPTAVLSPTDQGHPHRERLRSEKSQSKCLQFEGAVCPCAPRSCTLQASCKKRVVHAVEQPCFRECSEVRTLSPDYS